MLVQGFSSEPTAAENAVLDELSGVLVGHLQSWNERRRNREAHASSPVLIQIDGPGRSLFLEKLATQLEDPEPTPGANDPPPSWTVIRFDAWQYQRVAPPWWWLIKAIDRGLRDKAAARGGRLAPWRWRLTDYWWRLKLLLHDVAVAVPPVLLAALVAGAAWYFSGKHAIGEILQWGTTALAALTALLGFGWSAANALRRHLLVASPAGAQAVLQTSDPMGELMERYAFLVGYCKTPVAILIDNLDRCRADYVVQLLEGIQTLFKDEVHDDRTLPTVLYVVAADRGWLCDSYLTVYDEFKESSRQPGRPFGQTFLDKVFDFSLRIPTVSAAISLVSDDASQHDIDRDANAIRESSSEREVRAAVARLERDDAPPGGAPAPPNHELRRIAVGALAALEHKSDATACVDTEVVLRELAARAEPGPMVVRHLAAAYCVNRTVLLLGGHEVDDKPGAIERLGLWTILGLRWPLLTEQLARTPEGIETLAEGTPPDTAGAEIGDVYKLPEAQRIGELAVATGLDARAVTTFTVPIDVIAGRLSYSRGGRPRTFARA